MMRWMASLATVGSLASLLALAPSVGASDRAPPDITGLTVASINQHVVQGQVGCVGEGTIQIQVDVNQPSRGYEHARGRGWITVPCERQVYRAPLQERSGRYRNGLANVRVVARASAGPERDKLVIRERRPIEGERWYTESDTVFAEGLDAWVKRVVQVGESLRAKVHLVCPVPMVVDLSARAVQFVTDGVIEGAGAARTPGRCDGPTDVVVTVTARTGVLRPGRLNLDVHADPITTSGQALMVHPVSIDRRMRLPVYTDPSSPEGPVRIDDLATDRYGFTVTCRSGSSYDALVRVYQQRGRRTVWFGSQATGPCGDGVMHVAAADLRRGRVLIEAETTIGGLSQRQIMRRQVE